MTQKTPPSHLLIDAYGKSPSLDRIVDKILTHFHSANVFRRMVGERYKFRGYNVRLMTGNHDPGPRHPQPAALPHEWHRDSPGEFGIGIFLTDVPEGGNAGTALLRGSHLYPYCPRWNCLFYPTYAATRDSRTAGIPSLARWNLFNRWLGKRMMTRAVEAHGDRGDCFFFFNDVWHGRYPNLHGNKSMIVLIGGFPSEFPFPDKVSPPPAEVMEKLPETIRRGLTPQPENADKSTVVHWMLAQRRRATPFGLFFCARLERQVANGLSLLKIWYSNAVTRLLHFVSTLPRRVIGKIKRTFLGTASEPKNSDRGRTASTKAEAPVVATEERSKKVA